jgi:fructokinase
MKRPFQILSVGEVLVDFVSTTPGSTLQQAPQFDKCAGGAPANVAVGIARLGTPSGFVGKVGNDSFGRFLIGELRGAGVDASDMVLDDGHKTRLAFVSLMKNGDRDFEFWEQHPADQFLRFSEVNRKLIKNSSIVNIGALLLVKNPSRTTALRVARNARELGRQVCYDPNLRLSLWKNHHEGRRVMTSMLRLASIVRLNDAEAAFFTGSRNPERAAANLRRLGAKLVVITRGEKGCYFQTERCAGFVKGFKVRPLDTTGCGDGFLAALLHGLVQIGTNIDTLTEDDLQSICTVANAVGAFVATKHGAIAAMPTQSQLKAFIKRMNNK